MNQKSLLFYARFAHKKGQAESERTEKWQIWESGLEGKNSYGEKYLSVTNSKPLESFIRESFNPNEPMVALEIGGQGKLLMDLIERLPSHFSGGIYTSLGNHRDSDEIQKINNMNIWGVYRERNNPSTTGSVLSNRYWKSLRGMQQQLAPKGLGICFIKLEGGWNYVPDNLGLYYFMLNNLFNLMKIGGQILMDTPEIDWLLADYWFKKITKLGIAEIINTCGNEIRIIKLKAEELPTLTPSEIEEFGNPRQDHFYK